MMSVKKRSLQGKQGEKATSGLPRGDAVKENWAANVPVATQPGIIATIYLSPIACDAHLCGRALLKKIKNTLYLDG
ncbi:MAG: hypothetical protein HUU01_24105 [Saprospiraceae bacterium]|nr:hypothetical protein [Saprospiraceae bacterium]